MMSDQGGNEETERDTEAEVDILGSGSNGDETGVEQGGMGSQRDVGSEGDEETEQDTETEVDSHVGDPDWDPETGTQASEFSD